MAPATCFRVRPSLLVSLLAVAGCSGGGGTTSTGTLTVASNTLAFTAPSTTLTPPAQKIRASVTGASGTVYLKVTYTAPVVSLVLNARMTSATTGEADVYPGSPWSLGPGVHPGAVQVWACTSGPDCTSGQLAGSPQTIAVTYTVLGVAASTSSVSFAIGNLPAPADHVRELTVTATPGQTWTAACDQGWLSLSAAAGAGGTTPVTVSLVPALVGAMANGTRTAKISLVPSSGNTVEIPVTLQIARTQLDYVSPGVAIAGAPGDVIIRGQRLDQVAIRGLSFGEVAAASFQLVSATEIRAGHPALAAGSYPVRLQTDLGVAPSLATVLTVIDPPSYPPAVLAYPTPGERWFTDLAYDARRRALLVGVQEGLTVELLRYAYADGAGWGAPTVKPYAGLAALEWSPDGQLLVGTDGLTDELDPSTLAEVGWAGGGPYGASQLAVTNDGRMLAWGYMSVYRCTLGQYEAELLPGPDFAAVQMEASGDGSRVVIGGNDYHYQSFVYVYDASTGTLSSLGQRPWGDRVASVDRTGARMLIVTSGGFQVFDAALQLLGSLPATTRAAVLNPAGTRAYAYEPSGTAATIRAFDLTQTPIGGAFPELGAAVTLTANPVASGGNMKLAISPDGGTLFFAGRDAIVVHPAPSP